MKTKKIIVLAASAASALLSIAPGAALHADETLGHCASIEKSSNTLTDFMVNRCRVTIIVLWRDQGECCTKCSVTVGAGRKESIGKVQGNSKVGACEYPNMPRSDNDMYSYTCG